MSGPPTDVESSMPRAMAYMRSSFAGTEWSRIKSAVVAAHEVSWTLLLLPIILTTAFVIFGAWRRAVRDAEVEAVGEGVLSSALATLIINRILIVQ